MLRPTANETMIIANYRRVMNKAKELNNGRVEKPMMYCLQELRKKVPASVLGSTIALGYRPFQVLQNDVDYDMTDDLIRTIVRIKQYTNLRPDIQDYLKDLESCVDEKSVSNVRHKWLNQIDEYYGISLEKEF